MKKIGLLVKGFTMVELLVVISIVSVLLSGAMVYTANAKKKGQDGLIIAETDQVKSALEIYASNNNGGYPNPTPGTKALYCVGGDKCSIYVSGAQTPVTTKLTGLPIADFTLPPVAHDGGFDQGIIYESCGDNTPTCPPVVDDATFNPDTSTGAELVFRTNGSGSSQSFAGSWRNLPGSTYVPPTVVVLPVTTDMWIIYHGITFGQGTYNTAFSVAPNNGYTVYWTSTNADSCTITLVTTNTGFAGNNATVVLTGTSGSTSDFVGAFNPFPSPTWYIDSKNYSVVCSNVGGSATDTMHYP